MENSLKNLSKNDKMIQKPDFSKKTGREFLAFYLRTKLKQVISYDKKAEKPLFIEIKEDFSDIFLSRLINEPKKPIMIGITGESASGKTTICNEIKKCVEEFELPVSIVNADNYFNDISELIKNVGDFDTLRDKGYDVDSPNSFQMDLLREDLENLLIGNDIKSPKYLINGTGISVPKQIPVKSNKIIVVEGMSSMYKKLYEIYDIKIYIEIPDDLRKKRFMKRASDRNQNEENAKKHWDYVNQSSVNYIKPSRKFSEVVISGECDLNYFRDILEYLKYITNNFESIEEN